MNALIACIASLEALEFHENGEATYYHRLFLCLEGRVQIPTGENHPRRNWLAFLGLGSREILIAP